MLPTSNWLSDFIFLIFFCFFAVWVVRRVHDLYTTNGACWLFCFGWRGNSSFKNRIGRVYLLFERHRCGLRQFCSSGIVAWGPVYNLFESFRLWIGFGIGTGCFCSRSCLCYSVCTWNRYVPCSHKFDKKVLDCSLVYPVWAWFVCVVAVDHWTPLLQWKSVPVNLRCCSWLPLLRRSFCLLTVLVDTSFEDCGCFVPISCWY